MSPVDLDKLGWDQFELLAQALLKHSLGLGIEAWGGSGDLGRDAYYEGTLHYPTKTPQIGPFLFQCKFVNAANAAGAKPKQLLLNSVSKECREIRKRLAGSQWPIPPTIFTLLTNAPLDHDARRKIMQRVTRVLPKYSVHSQDGKDVVLWLAKYPQIARHFPQLLGLGDLEDLLQAWVNADILERSAAALAEAKDLAPVFVPTTAYYRARDILQKHHFVVLEGPPEMGKTAIGRMIGLAQVAQGWSAIEAGGPQDILREARGSTPTVFLADDFFGRGEYDVDRLRKWEAELPHILSRIGPKRWLVLTIRMHLLNFARHDLDVAGNNERFPDLGEVLVDASSLDEMEKARILYRHAKNAGLQDQIKFLVRSNATSIISDPHFTPERIRRLVKELSRESRARAAAEPDPRRFRVLVRETLADPSKAMRISFRRLPVAHKWLLIALLESQHAGVWGYAREGRDGLLQGFERLCPADDLRDFDDIVNDLSEAFIKLLPPRLSSREGSIDWIHPSYRDLVLNELRGDPQYRRAFFARASVRGLRLATSIGTGPTGKLDFPLLKSPTDWNHLEKRCMVLLQGGHDVLTALWQNYEAALKQERGEDRTSRLGELILESLVPHFFDIRQKRHSWTIQALQIYYEIRERAHADMRSPTISNLVEESSKDAMAELNDDDVYWNCLSARGEFHRLVLLILKYDETQLENVAIRGPIGKAVDVLRDWGERYPTDGYDWDEPNESIPDAYDACDNLARMYSTFADLPHLDLPEAKSLRVISSQFKSEASTLAERMPYDEEDDRDYRGGSSGGATSVEALFVDL